MRSSTVRPDQLGEWLTVQEACALIGVSPATLRRWSDAGEVSAYTTPGGHRRFARSTLLALLPSSEEERPSLARLGETPERMARACRRGLPTVRSGMSWLEDLDEDVRTPLREHGSRIATALMSVVDAPSRRASRGARRVAASSASECGRIAAECGVEQTDVVDAFLRFRMLFLRELAEIARRRRFAATHATELVITAATVFDELLLVLLHGHEDASAQGVRTP